MEQPIIFDNINTKVVDELRRQLRNGTILSIAAATFSIYAFEALKEELSNIEELRFIFTSPTFNTERSSKQKREFYIPKLNRERTLYGSDFEIRLRNRLSQKAIARECAEWIRSKARFRSNITDNIVNPHLTVVNDKDTISIPQFNEFTTTELGCESGNTLNQIKVGVPFTTETDNYLRSFDNLWRDTDSFKDVTDTIIDNIESVYRENSPDFIYFVTLYNIFNEFLEDISEDVLPNEATGFRNSQIWSKLYNFQRDAALAIINKLEKYNGCILADSVGLGKTFTALSVIKYYENRNKSVLVLCPKKLYENWVTFRANYRNNPIAADRLRYDILFHSDLSRDRGKSAGGLDLDYINWGNYDLVVIDESHNFRNGGKISTNEETGEERENRFLRLMNRVIKPGVKTKVLMLSATPVNNRFNDLKNQLSLAYEGDSENINGLLDTDNT
ncbi:MAG: DEAD/DEAH box helicase family protein, partial [Muribaculaceae bacterium]|nr:DEAD/DEAH box helicase family protein [Muribaculaceae bacterium]